MAKKKSGRFDTREELEENIYVLSLGNGLSDTEIGRSCDVSPSLVSSILKQFTPTPVQKLRMLRSRAVRLKGLGYCVQYIEMQIQELEERTEMQEVLQ